MEVVTYLHMRHILPVLGTWEVALRLLKKEKKKNIASVSRPGQGIQGALGFSGCWEGLVGSSGDSQDLFCCFFFSSSSFFLLLFLLLLRGFKGTVWATDRDMVSPELR